MDILTMKYLAYLYIRKITNNRIVDQIGLTNLSPTFVKRAVEGMSFRLPSDCYIDTSEVERNRQKEATS
jgi:hypothetical protein